MINKIKCPLCNQLLTDNSFYNILDQPTNQNITYNSIYSALNCKKSDINLVVCDNCGLVFNSEFSDKNLDYSENYDNCNIYSKYYVDYLDNQINYLIKKNYYNNNSLIVEVGCGKGNYLDILADKLNQCSFFGFDTSYEGSLNVKEKNIYFYKKYYPNKDIKLSPNIVICRHVIEHISSPILFLKSIRDSLNIGSYLFLETPDFNWIINNNSLFDIFYEHCNYWTIPSLSNALAYASFKIIEYKTGYNGQYLWIIAQAVEKNNNIEINHNLDIILDFKNKFYYLYNKFSNIIINLYKLNKKIALWGAGAKGSSFVSLFDPSKQYINCLIDINPNKQNKYIGKTGHKIISPNDIKLNNINYIINLNSNYANEIKELLFINNMSYIDFVNVNDLLK
jgi:SAM-dependent methyltransferase